MEAGYGNEADLMRTLEGALAGRTHLVGDRFTVADLYMAALLGYYMRVGELAPTPVLEAYAGAHLQRPTAQRANARDDALVAERAESA